MGCDIHLIAQVRGEDGIWRTTEVERDCSCKKGPTPGKWVRKQDGAVFDCWGCNGDLVITGYDERNYDAFAILADVRNGAHGDTFIPISEAKGLPDDLRKDKPDALGLPAWDTGWDNYGEIDGTWLGDHSFSWLTLRELLEYPHWEKVIHKQGWVGMEEFREWDLRGAKESPRSYSGGVGGGGVIHVDNNTMRDLIKGGEKMQAEYGRQRLPLATKPSYYTLAEWTSTYMEEAGNFFQYFIEALGKLGEPDDVRIVFGFDS